MTIVFAFLQSANKANGGLNSMAEIMLGLGQKHDVLAITQKETDFTQRLKGAGVDLRLVPVQVKSGWRKVINVIGFSRAVRKVCLEREAEVLHINDIRTLIHLAPVLKTLKLKKVFNIRDVLETHRSYDIKWKLVNICDDIIVLSHSMKEQLQQKLPLDKCKKREDHFHVSYSVVDFNRFKAVKQCEIQEYKTKLGFEKGKRHLLYVATINFKKNQVDFIKEAMPLLREQNIVVHFIGDFEPDQNSYAAECLTHMQDVDSEGVRFHGFQKNVDEFYKAGDLTLVPTRREGLARCMIESISCGTPVVSFDVASSREILESDRPAGLVVPQGDYHKFCNAIFALLEDEELYQTYSENGYMLSRQLFRKDIVVKLHESIYLNATRSTLKSSYGR